MSIQQCFGRDNFMQVHSNLGDDIKVPRALFLRILSTKVIVWRYRII